MMNSRNTKVRLLWAVHALVCLAAPGALLADGSDPAGLGAPGIAISGGTGIVAAGTGMETQPGTITIAVPAGATINQVLLYWSGFDSTAGGGDDTIIVNGIGVIGLQIGGPTLFFSFPRDFWATTYRADITALSAANNWIVPGMSVLSVDGLTFAEENDGAGILVIYDEGTVPSQIDLRDGSDLAFDSFLPPLKAVVPQTFSFVSAPFDRQADLVLFVGSVDANRASRVRVTSGGNIQDFDDLLGNTDGPQWDTVSGSITVPAAATDITFEIISGPPGGPLTPASLNWVNCSFAVLPQPISGTIIIEKDTVPAGGTGFGFTDNVAAPNAFTLNDGASQTFLNVPAGSYVVREDDPQITPGGFDLTQLVCSDSEAGGAPTTVSVPTRTANINLDPGETVTCTFVNSEPEECRFSASEKGSLLFFSKVDLRWDAAGRLIQDTFIDLTNDYPGDVCVQMYYVNGDPPTDAIMSNGVLVERAHPGWNNVDAQICLTANQPTYWSAATGLPAGVAPFSILDPGPPPGRPVYGVGSERTMRGYLMAWAVNSVGEEIRWNHLKGDAVIVNYAMGTAWEYTAWVSRALSVPNGAVTGTPGVLHLDGTEYCPPYDLLLLDFYAVGAAAFSEDGRPVALNTDLTLFPVSADLRQETDGPVTTKASFTIWNMNEVKLTGLDLCITCWDQRLLSEYGIPNHFIRNNLQTDKGKARIDGLASQVCDLDFDPGDACTQTFGGPAPLCDPRDIVSEPAALLGVSAKMLGFGGMTIRGAGSGVDEVPMYDLSRWGTAGAHLIGMGVENAVIHADLLGEPPPERPVRPVGLTSPAPSLTRRSDADAAPRR